MIKRILTDSPELPLNGSSEIHLWQLNLGDSSVNSINLMTLSEGLTPEELNRADQIRHPARRRTFVQTRYWLRLLLAHYTSRNQDQIRIESNGHGKPRLAGTADHEGLVFNISHTDGMAILAFGKDIPLGVDVEHVKPHRASSNLVRYTLAKSEYDHWMRLDEKHKAHFFFRCWCTKEAFSKATGRGLALRIRNIVAHELIESFLAIPQEFGPPGQWHLHTWLQDTYQFALVYQSENDRLRIRTFNLPMLPQHMKS